MSYKEYTVKIYNSGLKEWHLGGRLHREDGPAIEYADGSKYWYLNGKLHRIHGPAAELTNGTKSWFINGQKYSEAEYKEKIVAMKVPTCEGKVVEIEGKKYKLLSL